MIEQHEKSCELTKMVHLVYLRGETTVIKNFVQEKVKNLWNTSAWPVLIFKSTPGVSSHNEIT